MKYGKILSKCFKQQSNDGYVAVALIAGLAAGALLGILFAPERGADTRKKIGDGARGVVDGVRDSYATLKTKIVGEVEELAPETEVPHFVSNTTKRRKSDIRDLVDEANAFDQPDESQS
ncbi:MAG: YtxH domain-containing protein [Pedobacter sp.]|nr:MAG: YtxH domain-containing protein [Pedobacter sp.]